MLPECLSELTICVAIPTYNREQVLVDTISQVLAQNPPADEVLVIDQTVRHSPATEEYLANADKTGQVRWIKQSWPNLPAARNRALAETLCDVIVFIDDDVVIPPDFLAHHLNCYGTDDVDAVCGQIYQRCYDSSDDGVVATCTEFPPKKGFFPQLPLAACGSIGCLYGCNFSVRRRAYIATGGFDEQFAGSAYGEDTDFAFRLTLNGFNIVFAPDAYIAHLRVPAGGCRMTKNEHLPEWTKPLGTLIKLFRYGGNHRPVRASLIEALRQGPLRKENVTHPWRQPWAWLSFARALAEGFRRGRSAVKSPFVGVAAMGRRRLGAKV